MIEHWIPTRPPKRDRDARKRRRQEAAWARCRFAAVGHKRPEPGENCRSCGAPPVRP